MVCDDGNAQMTRRAFLLQIPIRAGVIRARGEQAKKFGFFSARQE
jgi:hypothetical protein